MNSILLYIDPVEAERQQMIQMAADLVEALTFQFEGLRPPPQSIGIIAEPSACLEIGLSMLGRGETRILEGGERRASPLMLYPFVSDLSRESGEIGLINREETGELGDFGMLDDLAVFGAIERDPELSWEEQTATEILERILRRQSWQSVVVFASDNALSQIQESIRNDETRIINTRLSSGQGEDKERVSGLLEQLESIENEGAHAIQREAVINALRLETLLSRLESID